MRTRTVDESCLFLNSSGERFLPSTYQRIRALEATREKALRLVAAVRNSQNDPLGLAKAIQEWETI